MANPGQLILSYTAPAALAGRRIVKFVAGGVGAAAAATDLAIGVSDTLDATAGQTVDVIMNGSAEVVLGGTVAAGAPITSDANGAGVNAGTAGNIAIGYALAAGVAGDIIDVALARHKV